MKLGINKQTMLSQFIIRILIFLLFFLGIFIELPSFILYLFLPLIIANLVLGFINKKRDIFTNINFLVLYPFLFVIIIEYLVTILGTILSFIHVLSFGLGYLKNKNQKNIN